MRKTKNRWVGIVFCITICVILISQTVEATGVDDVSLDNSDVESSINVNDISEEIIDVSYDHTALEENSGVESDDQGAVDNSEKIKESVVDLDAMTNGDGQSLASFGEEDNDTESTVTSEEKSDNNSSDYDDSEKKKDIQEGDELSEEEIKDSQGEDGSSEEGAAEHEAEVSVDTTKEIAEEDADALKVSGYHSFSSAYPISVNTYYSDSLLNTNTSNYYKFTLASPGYVSFSFSHDYVDSSDTYWKLYLYDEDEDRMFDDSYEGNATKELTGYGTGLPAGNYYAVVEDFYYSSATYRFKVNYVNSPYYENEWNNSVVSATPINTSVFYGGNIMYRDDVDYYRFSLSKPGYVDFSFSHDYVNDDGSYWKLTLYNYDDLNNHILEEYYQGNVFPDKTDNMK